MNHIPLKYQKNIQNCLQDLTSFDHCIWTHDNFLQLLAREAPDHIEAFMKYSCNISKADEARMWTLLAFGGLYFDLDFYLTHPDLMLRLDPEIVLFEEIPEHLPNSRKQLYNGILAVRPRHPFIRNWIQEICSQDLSKPLNGMGVMTSTGPIRFYDYWSRYPEPKPRLFQGSQVMPLTNQRKLSQQVQELKQPIVAYTTWHEGTGWGAGVDNFQDTIQLKPDTVIVNSDGQCFNNAEQLLQKNRLFDSSNEQLVLSILAVVAIMSVLGLCYFVFRDLSSKPPKQ